MSRTDQYPVPALAEVAKRVGWNPLASAFASQTRNRVIVCPTTSPAPGYYVETEPSAVLPFAEEAERIGEAIWVALLACRHDPALGSSERTAWPAYRASGVKTVRGFQQEYVRISIEALPCVLRLRRRSSREARG